jgi:hypothetical protein
MHKVKYQYWIDGELTIEIKEFKTFELAHADIHSREIRRGQLAKIYNELGSLVHEIMDEDRLAEMESYA